MNYLRTLMLGLGVLLVALFSVTIVHAEGEIVTVLCDGKLTGDVRFPGEPWQESRQVRWLSIPWLKAELNRERGPRVTGNLVVQLRSK